ATAPESLTSQATASPPSDPAVARAALRLRSLTMTRAPSSAMRRAICAPSPRAAPVISAVLPASRAISASLLLTPLVPALERRLHLVPARLAVGDHLRVGENVQLVVLDRVQHHVTHDRRIQRVREHRLAPGGLLRVGGVAGEQ